MHPLVDPVLSSHQLLPSFPEGRPTPKPSTHVLNIKQPVYQLKYRRSWNDATQRVPLHCTRVQASTLRAPGNIVIPGTTPRNQPRPASQPLTKRVQVRYSIGAVLPGTTPPIHACSSHLALRTAYLGCTISYAMYSLMKHAICCSNAVLTQNLQWACGRLQCRFGACVQPTPSYDVS